MKMKYITNTRNLVLGLAVVFLIAIGIGFKDEGNATAQQDFLRFEANLSGAQEVTSTFPLGVDTDTTGSARIRFNAALTEGRFRLVVRDGVGITQAHLHCGRAGENGPVVVFLFGPVDPGIDVNGELARGTLRNDDILEVDCVSVIGIPVNNIASLAFAAREGLIYANVHSEANPAGEVRGQLLKD